MVKKRGNFLVEEKKRIRKAMLDRLAHLEKRERERISITLQQKLFASDLWRQAETVGLYLSMANEWDTKNLAKQAWKEGKKVAVPKTVNETRELIFYRINDLSETVAGVFGILEPDPKKTTEVDKHQMDLMLVPGLAFTKKGYRIGFGGGYYDRFLKDYKHSTVSIVHSLQLIETFPIEPFDLPVDYLVTETEIIDCAK